MLSNNSTKINILNKEKDDYHETLTSKGHKNVLQYKERFIKKKRKSQKK